jgi:hypothetical protein
MASFYSTNPPPTPDETSIPAQAIIQPGKITIFRVGLAGGGNNEENCFVLLSESFLSRENVTSLSILLDLPRQWPPRQLVRKIQAPFLSTYQLDIPLGKTIRVVASSDTTSLTSPILEIVDNSTSLVLKDELNWLQKTLVTSKKAGWNTVTGSGNFSFGSEIDGIIEDGSFITRTGDTISIEIQEDEFNEAILWYRKDQNQWLRWGNVFPGEQIKWNLVGQYSFYLQTRINDTWGILELGKLLSGQEFAQTKVSIDSKLYPIQKGPNSYRIFEIDSNRNENKKFICNGLSHEIQASVENSIGFFDITSTERELSIKEYVQFPGTQKWLFSKEREVKLSNFKPRASFELSLNADTLKITGRKSDFYIPETAQNVFSSDAWQMAIREKKYVLYLEIQRLSESGFQKLGLYPVLPYGYTSNESGYQWFEKGIFTNPVVETDGITMNLSFGFESQSLPFESKDYISLRLHAWKSGIEHYRRNNEVYVYEKVYETTNSQSTSRLAYDTWKNDHPLRDYSLIPTDNPEITVRGSELSNAIITLGGVFIDTESSDATSFDEGKLSKSIEWKVLTDISSSGFEQIPFVELRLEIPEEQRRFINGGTIQRIVTSVASPSTSAVLQYGDTQGASIDISSGLDLSDQIWNSSWDPKLFSGKHNIVWYDYNVFPPNWDYDNTNLEVEYRFVYTYLDSEGLKPGNLSLGKLSSVTLDIVKPSDIKGITNVQNASSVTGA